MPVLSPIPETGPRFAVSLRSTPAVSPTFTRCAPCKSGDPLRRPTRRCRSLVIGQAISSSVPRGRSPASQDRDAIGGWIQGQGDRQEGKRILGDLPRLQRGEGYLWAPSYGLLDRVEFPPIRTFDSSRTPKRGERLATPRTLAEVDLTAIVAALATAETGDPGEPKEDRRRHAQLERELMAAKARIETLEQQNRELNTRLERIAALAAAGPVPTADHVALPDEPRAKIEAKPVRPQCVVSSDAGSGNGISSGRP